MTYTITDKNITKPEATEHFSEDFEKLLRALEREKNMGLRNTATTSLESLARNRFLLTGLIPQLSKEEFLCHHKRVDKEEQDKRYERYVKSYHDSSKTLKRIKKELNTKANDEFYYRICPITGKKFHIITGEHILNTIQNFDQMTWGGPNKLRAYRGYFQIVEDKSFKSDDLKLRDRYHPDVVEIIKDKWNFKKNITVDATIDDGTPLGLLVEKGSINVAYNPNKHLNTLSVQNLKLYLNTKGIHYRIRGSKRVYLELDDIEI